MISKNLFDYVKIYENHLSADICRSTIKQLDTVNWKKHTFYEPTSKKYISYDNELSVSYDFIEEKEEINRKVWFALEQYILKDFQNFQEWFSGWTGYSSVRFNRYDQFTKMKIHCDHIHSMFDGNIKGIPILSVLGVLNDDYEGGEFVMFGDVEIKLTAGSVIVFPSNFMFPHEVKPIKSGTRYSYISWCY